MASHLPSRDASLRCRRRPSSASIGSRGVWLYPVNPKRSGCTSTPMRHPSSSGDAVSPRSAGVGDALPTSVATLASQLFARLRLALLPAAGTPTPGSAARSSPGAGPCRAGGGGSAAVRGREWRSGADSRCVRLSRGSVERSSGDWLAVCTEEPWREWCCESSFSSAKNERSSTKSALASKRASSLAAAEGLIATCLNLSLDACWLSGRCSASIGCDGLAEDSSCTPSVTPRGRSCASSSRSGAAPATAGSEARRLSSGPLPPLSLSLPPPSPPPREGA